MKHFRRGLRVSRLCLGAMTFGLQCDDATSRAITDTASEVGIDFFDTADVYSLGGGGSHRGDRRRLDAGPPPRLRPRRNDRPGQSAEDYNVSSVRADGRPPRNLITKRITTPMPSQIRPAILALV